MIKPVEREGVSALTSEGHAQTGAHEGTTEQVGQEQFAVKSRSKRSGLVHFLLTHQLCHGMKRNAPQAEGSTCGTNSRRGAGALSAKIALTAGEQCV